MKSVQASKKLISQFAGSSYPDSEQAIWFLFDQAWDSLNDVTMASQSHPISLIVPHIDFRVNLSLYAQTYRVLAQREKLPTNYVILGVGHQCPHEFASMPLCYQTPLGVTDTNLDSWNRLQSNVEVPLIRSPESFHAEHSLEFVVIWLQYLHRKMGLPLDFKIIPVLMGGLHEAIFEEQLPSTTTEWGGFAEGFKRWMGELNLEDTAIIASIDGCHVGPRFGHSFSVDSTTRLAVEQWEAKLWQLCSSHQTNAWFDHLCEVQNQFYFDGVGVLALLLQTFKAQARIFSTETWYEQADASMVTFSGGFLEI